MPPTLLIAEDEPTQRTMLTRLLERTLGYKVMAAEDGKQAIVMLQSQPLEYFSAAVLDINMPGLDGFGVLRYFREHRPDLPVLMLTADDDVKLAVRAIKEGATDFITKPVEPERLKVQLQNAIKMAGFAQELQRAKRDREGALAFSDLIGHEGGLRDTVAFGRKAAVSDVAVLLNGETGSGKELFARAIHGQSRRSGGPFIAINCGAIPETLVESTLFGHEKGAFKGAISHSPGKFREAEGGTIFLDEVGELSAAAQVKLLRVLQEREVEPVGATRPVKINIRIISATHRDLKQQVRTGLFREDLYFRLNVLPVTLPPLRDRRQDILPLAEHFLKYFSATDMLPAHTLDESAAQYLLEHSWPGNVRELENLIHRAMVLTDGEIIDAQHLGQLLPALPLASGMTAESELYINMKLASGKFKFLSQIEAEAMQRALEYYDHNIARAAHALGMAKSTFYRKIRDVS